MHFYTVSWSLFFLIDVSTCFVQSLIPIFHHKNELYNKQKINQKKIVVF